jgi:hypothetical protein
MKNNTANTNPYFFAGQGGRGLCGQCRFFDELETQTDMDGDTEGRCRRYPPQLDPNYDKYRSPDSDQDGQLESVWYAFPIVIGSRDWCGEFKARK